MTPGLDRTTNSFWTAQVPTTDGGALTFELLHRAFDHCFNQPVQGTSYLVTSKETICAAAPMGQEMLDSHFAERAKGAARHIFGNLLPPLDAFAAGKYAIGGEWPYEVSDEIAPDYRAYWDEDYE